VQVSLHVIPNYELIQKLLMLGDNVKVLSPKSLVKEIKSALQTALRPYEVVKISDDSTMTIQTWESKERFQSAMPKAMGAHSAKNKNRENFVVSYQGYSGEIVLTN